MPWTTLMFFAVASIGHLAGFDWLWLGLAVFADFAIWSGNAYSGRRRIGHALSGSSSRKP